MKSDCRRIWRSACKRGAAVPWKGTAAEGNGCGRVVRDGPSGAGYPHAAYREGPQVPDGLVVARAGSLAVLRALDGLVPVRVGLLALPQVRDGPVRVRAGFWPWLGFRACWLWRGPGLGPRLGLRTGWFWCGPGFGPWLGFRTGWFWCGPGFRPRLGLGRAGCGAGLFPAAGSRDALVVVPAGFRPRLYGWPRWLHRLGVTWLGRRMRWFWIGPGFWPWQRRGMRRLDGWRVGRLRPIRR